jgi:hypothetical protein
VTVDAGAAHIGSMDTLTPSAHQHPGDIITRLALAQEPGAESQTLWQLIDDANTTVANTARHRLGLALRPLTPVHVVHIPVMDPATGRVVKP